MIYHELETERLRLRIFTPGDVDDFYRILLEPDVLKFMADHIEFSKATTLETINRFISAFMKRGFGRWAMIHKDDGKLIGYCGLIVLGDEIGVELAYLMSKEYWGRGLATEAARACLRYGFEALKLERVAAISTVENSASRSVMQRLGMTFVESLNYFGHDCIHYAINRDEFRFDSSPYVTHEVSHSDDTRNDLPQSRFFQTP